jgi:NitT/TauT family transport system substrate-binding protein
VLTKSGTEIKSFEELEGKTIYTIANGTPKVILQHILNQKGINATVATEVVINNETKTLAQPNDLASAIIAGAVDIALVPEPVATAAPLKVTSEKKDYSYKVALDLTDVWATISETPVAMGCIVGRSEFVAEHKTVINSFLDEYKASIEFIQNPANIDTSANYIVEASVLGAAGAAKKSLMNLSDAIAYKDGDEMKTILIDFYNSINPALIGGKLPDENFYYKK